MIATSKSVWLRTIRSFALSVAAVTALAMAGVTAAQAAAVTVKVVSARAEPLALGGTGVVKGAPVASYKFLVNIDNTGQTTQRSPATGTGCSPQDAGYPNSCLWTSIAGAASHSPVYTQGTQANVAAALANVPNGRYLISVLADGYKLDGRHFTVNGSTVTWEGKAAGAPASEVLVELQPTPLPDAQIQAAVFEDVSPVNSAPDLPAEHGLAGFQGHILDVLGEVTTDVYGAPLCGTGRCLSQCYVVNNGVDIGIVRPIGWTNSNALVPPTPNGYGRCPIAVIDDATGTITPSIPMYGFNGVRLTGANANVPDTAAIEGKVKIPNLGPNRYTLSVTPPDGSGFIQTTTLEGNHDWDAWVMEGATGLDTEFLIGGEPFPAIIFGYVPVPGTPSAVGSALPASVGGTGSITGVVEAVKIYVPTTGGVGGLPGEIWGGLQGAKIDKPIANPWVTLTNLGNGDTIVWAGQGDVNGKFTIPSVAAGTYTLTWWDEPQNTILDLVNVTVGTGENIDMGILPLAGWWTFYEGYVFNDTNRNGVRDAGEPGLPGYTLTMRRRDNSLMDRGSTVVTTDANGYYKFEAAYPMTQFLVMEAYDDLHYTTGITYQADNQNTPTTLLGAGVDVSVHPIIGLGGTMDWGKHNYDATGATGGVDPRNGGIVGTVSYDTTRNELDPRYAAVEDWQPSISDLVVKLYKPAPSAAGCVRQNVTTIANGTATCDSTGRYAVAPNGNIVKGQLLNTYLSETWKRPNGCVARGLDGTPYVHGTDEQVLPTDDSKECIEAPLMGVQFWGGDPANGTFPGVEVDGNYGFGDGCFGTGGFNETTGACADSSDPTSLPAGDYLVQVDLTSQKDTLGNNVYKVTREEDINIGNGDEFIPAVPPSACAGEMHKVDSSGNATFPGGPGTSPYENQMRPLCDVKLVTVSNGKSIAPSFNLFTDVPIPGRHWFIIIDDLNFSSNPKSV
ncbi:MAG: SdrD B-like domain-containing protein, partial [Burkholderiales bacterium]